LSLFGYCSLAVGMVLVKLTQKSAGRSLLLVCQIEIMMAAMHAGAALNFYANDLRGGQAEVTPAVQQEAASWMQLQALLTVTFSEISLRSDDANCSVCLGEYAAGDVLSSLPCGHQFHRSCAHKWLTRSKQCPLCRCAIDSETCTARACAR